MKIIDSAGFLDYFERIRGRTLRVARSIPPDRLEWTYRDGAFTFGNILRHLGAIERYMFAENAVLRPSSYPGHSRELADGWDAVFEFLDRMHQESIEILSDLSPKDLERKCETPAGIPITVWKWLRAMVEHEIHHRGQIYLYLSMLGIESPPLYGHTEEQVVELSRRT